MGIVSNAAYDVVSGMSNSDSYAVITFAIRLQYDYDLTMLYACDSTRAKNEHRHVSF